MCTNTETQPIREFATAWNRQQMQALRERTINDTEKV